MRLILRKYLRAIFDILPNNIPPSFMQKQSIYIDEINLLMENFFFFAITFSLPQFFPWLEDFIREFHIQNCLDRTAFIIGDFFSLIFHNFECFYDLYPYLNDTTQGMRAKSLYILSNNI